MKIRTKAWIILIVFWWAAVLTWLAVTLWSIIELNLEAIERRLLGKEN